jgi:hypothetical protein
MFFNKKIVIENGLLLYNNESKKIIKKLILEKKVNGIRIYCPFLEDCNKINNLDFLYEIEGIEELSILYSDELSFEFLYKMKHLKKLTIQTIFSKLDFKKMTSKIEYLNIGLNDFVENIKCLESLKILNISIGKYKNNEFLKNLKKLNHLSVSDLGEFDLNLINDLNSLKSLRMVNVKDVVNVKGLENLNNLTFLEINNCKNIIDINDFFELKRLEYIEIIDCNKINLDFKNIKKLKQLKQLTIFSKSKNISFECDSIENIENVIINKFKKGNLRLSYLNMLEGG